MGQKLAFEKVLESLGQESFSKGIKFERVLKWWLQNEDIWSKELLPDSVKLWEESTYRTGPDIGIDLTATDIHGNVWAIQAKNWNSMSPLERRVFLDCKIPKWGKFE